VHARSVAAHGQVPIQAGHFAGFECQYVRAGYRAAKTVVKG
jgi:hypothetical protein